MKKILSLLLALTMVVGLSACGGTKDNDADKTGDNGEETAITTVKEGVLTVATSPDFAPYEFYSINENGDHELAGFDIALAAYIADYLELKLEIIPMDFDGVLLEIASGNVDIGLAGLSPDPDRMDAMDFSDLYYMGGQSFVTIKGNEDKFPTLEAANNPQFSIGAQTGSIQYALAQEFTPDADIIMLTKVTDIITELIAGKISGAFIETVVAESYAANYPDLIIVHEVPYDTEGSAAGVAKGNEALLAAVNEAIAAALADGSMDDFVAKANELATGQVYEGILKDDA